MSEREGPSSSSLFKPVAVEQHRCSAVPSRVQRTARAKPEQKEDNGIGHATNDPRSIGTALLQRLRSSRWAKDRLNLLLDPWQVQVADAGAGSQALALCHRQSGKSFVGAVVIAHEMDQRESTNLVLAPTVRQSSEAIRTIKQFLIMAGHKLAVDNTFSLELDNGSRVLAMPGSSDASIRGYSVSGCLLLDEAARVTDDLYAAARPMRARFPASRMLALSTPWAKQGWFYEICEGDPAKALGWLVVRADPTTTGRLSDQFLATERAAMSPGEFRREYELEFLDTIPRPDGERDHRVPALQHPLSQACRSPARHEPSVTRALRQARVTSKPGPAPSALLSLAA